MAIEMFCDQCGKQIEERPAKFMGLEGGRDVPDFHYHSGECFAAAEEALANLAKLAYAEDAEFRWVLVKRHRPEEIGDLDLDDAFRERWEYRERWDESELPTLPYVARTGLIRAGIWKREHLAGMTEAELRQVAGVGEKSVAALRRELQAYGMDLLAEEVAG